MKKWFILLPIFLIFFSIIFHKTLIESYVNSALKDKGIKADLVISKLGFNKIIIKSFEWEGVLSLNHAIILFENLNELKEINLEIEKLNLDGLLSYINKDSQSKVASKKESQYKKTQHNFEKIRKLKALIKVKNLIFKNQNFPLNLELFHQENTPHASLSLFGSVDKRISKSLSIDKAEYKLSSAATIKSNFIRLRIDEFFINALNLRLKDEKLMINSWEQTAALEIDYFANSSIAVNGGSSIKGDLFHNDQPIEISSNDIGLSYFQNENKEKAALIETKDIHFLFNNNYKSDEVVISVNESKNKKLIGDIKIDGFQLKDRDEKILAESLNLIGNLKGEKNEYELEISAFDTKKNIVLGGNAHFNNDNKKFSIDYKTNDIVFDDNWQPQEAFPSLKELVKKLGGNLTSYGKVNNKNGKIQTNARFKTNDFSMNSEFLTIEGLSLDHRIIDHSTLASLNRHELLLDKLIFGATLEDINLNYQIINKSKIKVHSLGTKIEGAKVNIENVLIWPKEKRASDLKAVIENLDLEKAIKLGLKEGIKAKGTLDGFIEVGFVKNKPMIKNGRLKVRDKGWIQYRPEGQKQLSNALHYLTNPSETLKQYLYDFKYDTLEVDLSSDENYDMNMTLRAFGRNPKVLDGKPLKLNVNLELNLLRVFRSIVMTYHLPEKLKDKLLKAGSK